VTIPSGSSLTVADGVVLTNNGEVVVESGGTLNNEGVIEDNGGKITGNGNIVGKPSIKHLVPLFTIEHSEALDGSRDVIFAVNWNLSALRSLTINGHVITMKPSAGNVRRMLSGYPGYPGNIGRMIYSAGGTEIVLYGSFIRKLAESEAGRQTMSVNFGTGYDYYASTVFTARTTPGILPQDDGIYHGGGGGGDAEAGGAGIAGLLALAALSAGFAGTGRTERTKKAKK
jgi:hypothetical protein